MPKKSNKKRPADRAPRREAAKELSAEQLENVAGGVLTASGGTEFKFFRPGTVAEASDIFVKIGDIKGEYSDLALKKK